jgi:hypothetical protein
LLLSCGCIIAWANLSSAGIAFDTFGPGNTYQQGNAYIVSGPAASSVSNTFEEAARFVAASGGSIGEVDLGLTTRDGGPVDVYLYGDAGGSPDNLTQTLLGSVTPTQSFGTTNNSIVSLSSLNGPSIDAGTAYWLVLKPGTPTMSDDWNRSLSTAGIQDISHDDENWIEADQGNPIAAFRITTVPEPRSVAAMILTAAAALKYGALQVRRRRKG